MLLSDGVRGREGQQLQDAIAAVGRGRSKRGATAECSIPVKTPKRHCKGGVAQPDVSQLGRMRPVFDEALENGLVATIKRNEREMYDGNPGCQASSIYRCEEHRENAVVQREVRHGRPRLATHVHEATPYYLHYVLRLPLA